MNLGEQIKTLRKAKSWTQAELAERCGITLRTIQRIESNSVKPSLFSLKKLSEVLETDLSERLTEVTEPNSTTSNPIKRMNSFFPLLGNFLRRNSIFVSAVVLLLLTFFNWEKVQDSYLQVVDDTTIQVETINCGSQTACDILLTKSDQSGAILWQKTFGGTSYDKAEKVIKTQDQGYLIVGSTSSFGQGNYDVFLIKVTSGGEIQWQQTYGAFFNEYGYSATQLSAGEGFEIEGTQQTCTTPNVSNDCKDSLWKFQIDKNGQRIS